LKINEEDDEVAEVEDGRPRAMEVAANSSQKK
jgi:hypothetical protein